MLWIFHVVLQVDRQGTLFYAIGMMLAVMRVLMNISHLSGKS
jgi:hypothetical protein